MSDREVAIATIKTEHRALGAVVHTMQEMLGKIATGHESPEFGLFAAALYYIDDFQERCHHPKEDEYLFKLLTAATSEFDAIISGLQVDHVTGAHTVLQLHRHLVHYQGGAPQGLEILRAGIDAYAMQRRNHIRCEDYLLERSWDVLSESDWTRIAAAFDENDDPLFGNNRRDEFARLYYRIVVPAPRKLKQGLYPASHI